MSITQTLAFEPYSDLYKGLKEEDKSGKNLNASVLWVLL